jgi:dipeptidyl aminopeptidase/acylaminoacyl peptidase
MSTPQIAPYGSWKSPITSDAIVAGSIGLGQIFGDNQTLYWLEMRPQEAGRNVLVSRSPQGEIQDIVPAPFNVRTRVCEYGGGAFTVSNGTVYFSNFSDSRLYHQPQGEQPQPLTPEANMRYADFTVDTPRGRLIAVREDHTSAGEPVTSLVSINLADGAQMRVLVAGEDFYATPRLSPDGQHLCWLSWNHPNMPWDGTELWVAQINPDGSLGETHQIAGGVNESIFQPQWSPDGTLYFVSDCSGWWNLYRSHPTTGTIEPVCEMSAEFGLPQWVFGMSTYGFASNSQLICTYTQSGIWHLGSINLTTGILQEITTPYTSLSSLQVNGDRVAFIGGSPTEPTAIAQYHLNSGELQILRKSTTLTIDRAYLSQPQPVEFPTENGLSAYGIFYPPNNQDYMAPEGELPPLLVKSHGGPTSSASSSLSLSIQYWTSRGFAVLDVNYGGSTGYGREYRQRLENRWGIVDVDDCANGAKYLGEQGWVDSNRLAIAGGSAGGYTTLCALTYRDVFKAGASYYGVSDLEALAKDTHKFESRYLDKLIGPYPEAKQIYIERSPIHACDRISCPVIFFQGLEDKIVPPNQAEAMVNALKQKGIPVAYLPFEGEQHGFRRSENIKRALDGEFYFYSRIFGFETAENLEPVPIDNF